MWFFYPIQWKLSPRTVEGLDWMIPEGLFQLKTRCELKLPHLPLFSHPLLVRAPLGSNEPC